MSNVGTHRLVDKFSDDDVWHPFQLLFTHSDIYRSYRFCIFIDALDEYQETSRLGYNDMIKILRGWTDLSRGAVKLCVSSREHTVFQSTLVAEQRIQLQDLTKNDMLRYTRERLSDLPDAHQLERLTEEIVTRSDGIFLCVVIVVKALREALEDGRDAATFEAELAILPTELEALFEHLLLSIPKTQLRKAYQIFAMVLQCEQYDSKLSLLSCLHLDAYTADPRFAMRDSNISDSSNSENRDALQSWHDTHIKSPETLTRLL
jgi:hypothetical protein